MAPLAAGLVVAERTGRAIRKPVVEAMLSHAGQSIGSGWVFGLNEALDQAGATIGPLVVALILPRRRCADCGGFRRFRLSRVSLSKNEHSSAKSHPDFLCRRHGRERV